MSEWKKLEAALNDANPFQEMSKAELIKTLNETAITMLKAMGKLADMEEQLESKEVIIVALMLRLGETQVFTRQERRIANDHELVMAVDTDHVVTMKVRAKTPKETKQKGGLEE